MLDRHLYGQSTARLWSPERRLPENIRAANFREKGPFSKQSRAKRGSARDKGNKYEKALGRQVLKEYEGLAEVKVHQWIEYLDDNGSGWAQPDVVILGNNWGAIIEAKLKLTLDAEIQLRRVYYPLMNFMLPNRRWVLVQAFQFWAQATAATGTLSTIRSFDMWAKAGVPPLYNLNWTR